MCTNHRQTKPLADMYGEFTQIKLRSFSERHAAPNLEPQLEVRPTNSAVVFHWHGEDVELARLRWGLVPWFHRGPVKA